MTLPEIIVLCGNKGLGKGEAFAHVKLKGRLTVEEKLTCMGMCG